MFKPFSSANVLILCTKCVGLEKSQFMSPTSRTFLHSVVDNILSISPRRDSNSRSFMLLFWESTIKYKFNTNNSALGKLNFVAWILKISHLILLTYFVSPFFHIVARPPLPRPGLTTVSSLNAGTMYIS